MLEYWVVYDQVSGDERWRGSGPAGSAAVQEVPEGFGLIAVPREALLGGALDLIAVKAGVAARVDVEAERLRMRFLTPGAGQAMTYTRKEAEARAWVADNDAATPFLAAEAAACGVSVAQLAAEVIGQADAWVQIGAVIEARRMGAKVAIAAAETLGAIVAASQVTWAV